MERLKTIKNQLISEVQTQMSDLKCVDAKELGEVIDMIKDIAQTEYYCEIYKQMLLLYRTLYAGLQRYGDT